MRVCTPFSREGWMIVWKQVACFPSCKSWRGWAVQIGCACVSECWVWCASWSLLAQPLLTKLTALRMLVLFHAHLQKQGSACMLRAWEVQGSRVHQHYACGHAGQIMYAWSHAPNRPNLIGCNAISNLSGSANMRPSFPTPPCSSFLHSLGQTVATPACLHTISAPPAPAHGTPRRSRHPQCNPP